MDGYEFGVRKIEPDRLRVLPQFFQGGLVHGSRVDTIEQSVLLLNLP
jgi:hypothetical protein